MRQLKITQQITVRDSKSLINYLSDVSSVSKAITSEREIELAEKIKEGDKKAIEELVTANLRFVISVAKQYQSSGEDLSDLINEGNLGLIKAAERFDSTRGFKFISYAVWWIRQSIMQYLNDNSKKIRLPGNKLNLVNKIKNASRELEQELERTPTNYEIEDFLGDSIKEGEIDNLLAISSNITSIDSFASDDSATRLSELMPSDDEDCFAESSINSSDLSTTIDIVLKKLTYREEFVIRNYYGIGMKEPKTLSEIADHLYLTRERARQIKEKAVRKLRHRNRSTSIKEYV